MCPTICTIVSSPARLTGRPTPLAKANPGGSWVGWGKLRCLVWCACILAVLGLSVGCSSPAERAQKVLRNRGLACDAPTAVLYAQAENIPVLELLQTAEFNFAEQDSNGLTALLAATQLQTKAVPFLLTVTPPAALDKADATGRTALSYAWHHQQRDWCRGLLERGARPDQSQHVPQELLASILRKESPADGGLAELALAACADASPAFPAAMVVAGERQCEPWLRVMLSKKASGHVMLPKSMISLFRQSLEVNRSQDFLSLLVSAGAMLPTPTNTDALNPLDFALRRKDVRLAEILTQWGANPLDATPKHLSPLAAAIQEKQLPMVELFLKKKVPFAAYLAPALAQADLPLLQLFMQYGWDPRLLMHLPNGRIIHPIHYAVEARNVNSVSWLLEQKVDPSLPGWHGQDSFVSALLTGEIVLLHPFLEYGYDVNKVLAESGKATQLFTTLTGSAYFNQWYEKDKDLTPLMLAAAKGQADIIELLLQHGAQRGAKTRGWKRFAVNFACENEHIEAAQLLLGRSRSEKRNLKITISLSQQRATIYRDGQAIRSTVISSGRPDFPTPRGEFVISDKQSHWMSSIYKVPMPYFMRLSCKDFGLHEGIVSTRHASHGCIRLPKAEAPEFFRLMRIGDHVSIR